ncbi:hypothetical protein HMPREF9946_02589 [Acetobacteraceae bacterium AT-5844]|nr:hypothetical protein HMPREF9946_02589 [Acetobacteraceae bacterium AT-5844]
MARAAPTERLLVRTVTDMGFDDLPMPVQYLWYRLLSFALGSLEKGCIRFSGFSGSVSASVSKRIPMPETEIETGLETLEKLGWLERDEAAHCLWMRDMRANAARAEAAKANGSKGGRPRKGETLEQARERKAELARRQGHFMMPISGGLAETQETEQKPNAESSRAGAVVTTTSDIEVSGGSIAREETDLVSLVEDLAATARLPAGRRLSAEPVAEWLAAGVSVGTIRSVVAKLSRRPSYDPLKVSTWRYFGPGIEEALAKRPEPQPAAHTPLAETVHDEDGARAGLDANGQLWVKGWKDARQRGQDTTAKEATMRSVCPAAWDVVQQLMRRAGEGAPENFWPERRVS